jgi:hypothetical protein
VAARARLWFVLPGEPGEQLAALARALAGRALSAVVAAADPASRGWGEQLASESRLEVRIHAGLAASGALAAAALGELAREHPGCELAIAAPAQVLRAALEACLGSEPPSPSPVTLRAGALYAFDWPAEADGASPPVLVGADLDWLPPWSSAQARNPYPGGPGAAGTARG